MRHKIKKTTRTEGFQAGGIAHDDRLLEGRGLDDPRLIVAGKVHSLVHTRDLLAVTIEHLGFDAVWIE